MLELAPHQAAEVAGRAAARFTEVEVLPDLVGRERVMAGVDCGFSIHVGMQGIDPDVAWAKLAALAQGAEIASDRLF